MKSVRSALIPGFVVENDGLHEVSLDSGGESHSFLLRREGEALRAWWNVCPHAGRRLDYVPGKFLRKDGLLICAAHGAMFRLDDGECVAGPCRGSSLREVALHRDAAGWWLRWEDES